MKDGPERTPGRLAWRAWETGLELFFLALCVRFIVVALWRDDPALPSALLAAGGFAAGALFPAGTAPGLAFLVAMPILNGLAITGMIHETAPLGLVFAGLYCGHWVGAFRPGRRTAPARERGPPGGVAFGLNLLATAVIASLLVQLWRQRSAADFGDQLWATSSFSFPSSFYFLTSASVWLNGIFWSKMLARARLSDAAVRGVLGSIAAAMLFFASYEVLFHVPEGWTAAGRYSPFEDISSFGSFAVVILVFCVAALRRGSRFSFALHATGAVLFLGLVIDSFSRASWMAAGLFIAVVAVLRLSWRWSVVGLALAGLASVVATLNVHNTRWQQNPFLWRFVALARLEKPTTKVESRYFLYEKAWKMIRERPVTGFGIGSFYLQSPRFGAPDKDPRASSPDFAHNVVLQLAAELGLPVTALFSALVIASVGRAIAASRRQLAAAKAGAADPDGALGLLALILAFAAYGTTQMTANSLNVYPSNQYLFWFLFAALLQATRRDGVEAAPPLIT